MFLGRAGTKLVYGRYRFFGTLAVLLTEGLPRFLAVWSRECATDVVLSDGEPERDADLVRHAGLRERRPLPLHRVSDDATRSFHFQINPRCRQEEEKESRS